MDNKEAEDKARYLLTSGLFTNSNGYSAEELLERRVEYLKKLLILVNDEGWNARKQAEFKVLGEHPIPMILTCPMCGARHIDEGEFATKVHHTHACQACGMVWRPAVVPTTGVQFLPGYKNGEEK